jgi:hypothetical protein
MDAQLIATLEKTHIALWNEKDPAHRQQLADTIYSHDIKMYDKDFILTGISEVLGFINKLLTEDPCFTFRATKPLQAAQNGVRLFWHIRTGSADLTGMDFFVLQNNKVQDLYVFMD